MEGPLISYSKCVYEEVSAVEEIADGLFLFRYIRTQSLLFLMIPFFVFAAPRFHVDETAISVPLSLQVIKDFTKFKSGSTLLKEE